MGIIDPWAACGWFYVKPSEAVEALPEAERARMVPADNAPSHGGPNATTDVPSADEPTRLPPGEQHDSG